MSGPATRVYQGNWAISSFEVEASVRGQPGVLECAAFAVTSEIADTEEEVMIAVAADSDGDLDVDALFRSLLNQ